MRTVLVILGLIFGLCSSVSAQAGGTTDFVFPRDIVGFRFGAGIEEIASHCRVGFYDHEAYTCHSPVEDLGFEADVYINFSDDRHASSVWIQTDPRSARSSVEGRFEALLSQLTDEFGNPDRHHSVERGSDVYTWIFEEDHRLCWIQLGIYSNHGSTGNLLLTFNTVAVN